MVLLFSVLLITAQRTLGGCETSPVGGSGNDFGNTVILR